MESGKKRGSAASLEQLDARISVGYCDHPKTKKLIRRLGFEGFYYHCKLILWCRLNKPMGYLDNMDVEAIELAVDWKGEPGALVTALCEVRLMDYDECIDEYRMHDWDDHQPWAVKTDERRASATLAGLVRQHGEEEGRRLFHEGQAARSSRRSTNPTGALDFGERPAQKSSAPSLSLAIAKPIHTLADAVAAGFVVPDWVPQEDLDAFIAMRATIKKPLTIRALGRQIGRLEEFRELGHDPKRVLNQSEDKRWQDLYALKDDAPRTPPPAGQPHRNGTDVTERANRAFTEVRTAGQSGKGPPQNWSDPVTAQALEAIGGWTVIREMRTDDVPFRQRDFVRAFSAKAGH